MLASPRPRNPTEILTVRLHQPATARPRQRWQPCPVWSQAQEFALEDLHFLRQDLTRLGEIGHVYSRTELLDRIRRAAADLRMLLDTLRR